MEQYIDDTFTTRDTAKAHALQCRSSELSAVDNLLRDVTSRETKFGITIAVTLDHVVTSSVGATAGIDANLTLDAPTQNVTERQIQGWHFDLLREGAWRLCAAQRTS